jgi:transposase
MAGKRINLMEIKELILLKKKKVSNRKVASLLGVSRNTVNSYTRTFEAHGFDYDELLTLDDEALNDLFPRTTEMQGQRYEELAQYFPYFAKELKKPGCTIDQLWQEYIHKHPDGYKSTQFNHHFNQWRKKEKGSLRIEHKAGEKLYLDFTGKKLKMIDKSTGEVQELNVLVGILPCSQYTFCIALPSQSKEDVIKGIIQCLEYFEGVVKVIITDNMKSIVDRSHKYAPQINRTAKNLALHYNCTITATRPYSPKDKAFVEGAVKLVYQRIFYPLSKHTFFNIEQVNELMLELVDKYNDYKFTNSKISATRRSEFLSLEKPYLQPLPSQAFEIKYYKRLKVQKMGYIYLSTDRHYYSVPYRYIGQRVEVEYTQKAVEIYFRGKRIALHKRSFEQGRYSTIKDHLSSANRAYSEWSLEYFVKKAGRIGPNTQKYIEKMIREKQYPETGYKQAQGLLFLTKQFAPSRIEKACSQALPYHRHGYHTIAQMLEKGIDLDADGLHPSPSIPAHRNIRGKLNYQ